MLNLPVLVLNQSYEPLNICRVKRAVVLLYQEKAEMLENGYGYIHTVNRAFPIPSVIRLDIMVRRPRKITRKVTRLEVFKRDDFICQYCGKEVRNLTIDHVIPRHQGGKHTWDNLVSACMPCNRRKAGRTPKEARMKLAQTPVPPLFSGLLYIPSDYQQTRDEWRKYLPKNNRSLS